MESRRGEFLISTDSARLDLDVIHGFLTNCYWAKGISREVVARSIEQSLCFGIYHEVGEKSPLLAKPARSGAPATRSPQVGFARVISDFATIAYLGDVFRAGSLSRARVECVDDGVHRAVSAASGLAAVDFADARCARAVREIWVYAGEVSG